MVDTCAAEFEASTPYYYSTYETEDEVTETTKEKVIVLVQVRFGSVKGLSLITQRFMRFGRFKQQVMKQLLSITTQKRYQRISILRIACTLNRCSSKML